MSSQKTSGKGRLATVVVMLVLVSGVWLSPGALRAGEADSLETSLQWIPQDAAFYCSMLRNREQIQIAADSKAWAKLKSMPVIQMGWNQYQEQAANQGSPAARIQAAQENPQIMAALETLADMLGQESFVYGGGDYIPMLDLLQKLVSTVRYGPMSAELAGDGGSTGQTQARLALTTAAENLDAIKIPTTIIGFKVEDTVRAKQQLDGLAGILTLACMAVPQMNNRLARTRIGDDDFITLSFDGEMAPWDQLPTDQLADLEANQGDAEKVIARLRALKMVIAFGLRGNYVLMSIGESTDAVAKLGDGPLLVDRPEFEPLRARADERICGVSYISQAMHRQLASGDRDIDDLLGLLGSALPESGLSEEAQSEIRKDAASVAEEIKALLPDAGAIMSFSFLTGQGVEGYSYNWSEQLWLDGSKPLELLRHTGGNPLLAAVWREVYRPQDYDMLVRWLEMGYGYFQKYALPEMSAGEREQFQQFVDRVGPLVERADKVNRELLMPALKDSQGGLVMDGKLKVTRLCREVPPLDEPMPMVEPAVVVGVSDADLLRKACGEYREIVNSVVDVLHDLQPNEVPDFEIPAPQARTTPLGEIFAYPLPDEWGVDKKIVPNFGLSEHVAVLSVSRRHTQRLLKETPLAAGGVLADADRSRAVAVAFDWAGLVDAATPWVELAARQIMKEQGNLDDDAAAAIMDQVHTVLEVFKVVRTCTLETYFEGDALVGHSLIEIRDID